MIAILFQSRKSKAMHHESVTSLEKYRNSLLKKHKQLCVKVFVLLQFEMDFKERTKQLSYRILELQILFLKQNRSDKS